MRKNSKTEKATKKEYKTPEIKKHKSVAVVSGSSCSTYSSKTSGSTYYH